MSGDKNAPAALAAGEPQTQPRLRRVLGLWDLVFYGIVLIQPVGAVGPFGLANKMSLGHVTATILIAPAAMFLVIGIFVVEATRFLWQHQGWAGLFSTEPFYNPRTFNLPAIGTATSLAALTYIGFDGITTLAEDVKEPKRTVPLAILLTCVVIGLCATLEVYLGQRVWPDYTTFKDRDTALFDGCELVGGKVLVHTMALILAVRGR